jgi:RES domain-containing protein
VILTARRVVTPQRAATAFDGEGSRLYGGRWTSPGHRAVYVASTTCLALLETIVHAPSTLLPVYVIVPLQFDSRFVSRIEARPLPSAWRTHPFPAELQNIGDEWLASGRSAVLRVPSAVVPEESNFLLAPEHRDFRRILIGKPFTLSLDARLGR